MIRSTIKSLSTTPTHLIAKLEGPVKARLPLGTPLAVGDTVRLAISRRVYVDTTVFLDATLA